MTTTSAAPAYRIENLGDCLLIHGDLPPRAWRKLQAGFADGTVRCPALSARLGASVWGTPAALKALRRKPMPPGPQVQRQIDAARRFGLGAEALGWLDGLQRCGPSNTVFSYLSGIDALGDWLPEPPRHAASLQRCRRLLDGVPEFMDRIPEMALLSPQWAALADRWDELCALLDSESAVDTDNSAPVTQAALRAVLAGCEKPFAAWGEFAGLMRRALREQYPEYSGRGWLPDGHSARELRLLDGGRGTRYLLPGGHVAVRMVKFGLHPVLLVLKLKREPEIE